MSSLDEIKEAREHKIKKLKQAGMSLYPAVTGRTHSNAEVLDGFETITGELTMAGRVLSVRGQGSIVFVTMFDGTANFQTVLKKDTMEEGLFMLHKETIDIGDIVEWSGELFVTQKGQQSLLASSWKMLTKSRLPLPDKHDGLVDDDLRYRKRYLDILTNPEVREIFNKRTKFWQTMRNFMVEKGFLEVETPYLEVTTGGAEATPFATHHNDYDMDVFLRISVGELWQKRLMAAGFEKTFEIGKVFRNEGSSPDHLHEFTNMEFYWGYASYRDGMELTKELYRKLATEVFETTVFNTRGHEFDLANDWEVIDYTDTIKEKTGIDITDTTVEDITAKLKELQVAWVGDTKERLIDTLWKYCRKSIAGPAFLVGHPKIVSPLAKEDVENPGKTERFQIILAGSEVGNGYSELNDPVEQLERFKTQQELIEAGDEEAMMRDDEFIEMLEHGMPPTCGFGAGDRLFSFFLDKPLRECILFPLMRPNNSHTLKDTK